MGFSFGTNHFTLSLFDGFQIIIIVEDFFEVRNNSEIMFIVLDINNWIL